MSHKKPPVAEPSADNRKARYSYEIIESLEVGIELTGTEVKSIRGGTVGLREAYARLRNKEVWLIGMHVPLYQQGSFSNHDPRRERKLLLHREQIARLAELTSEKGLALIPLRLYFTRGKIKIQLAVGRGKKTWDKRRAIAEREAKNDLARYSRR